ncbi:hypothetical protein C8N24_1892 [Solirubrobacter pauli]|uniref:Uncharacterized protein n=1 Tax=Solirubrobacter pauli TaxID=166793 RepID=A0A660LE14_9ACTN|nr:hypothetical protein [Solirubrobacter pauli]RKQ92053.1 hypothetical protein C8N24_1892 [Solirubrobacter pauli]
MSSEPKETKGGLQLSTLLISSLSAVAAAIIVPYFWERGSLIATAVTPIIVALVTEALNRPTKVITKAAPRVARRTGTGAAVRSRQPTGVGARGEGPERVGRWGDEDDPFGLRTPERTRKRRRFPWKLGIITGLVAAVIGAAVVTASELAIFGRSVGHSDRSTSVFGGSKSSKDDERATPTPTATETPGEEPSQTATPEATETPSATPTATASPTATATATPPAGATPDPQIAPTTTATPVPTP